MHDINFLPWALSCVLIRLFWHDDLNVLQLLLVTSVILSCSCGWAQAVTFMLYRLADRDAFFDWLWLFLHGFAIASYVTAHFRLVSAAVILMSVPYNVVLLRNDTSMSNANVAKNIVLQWMLGDPQALIVFHYTELVPRVAKLCKNSDLVAPFTDVLAFLSWFCIRLGSMYHLMLSMPYPKNVPYVLFFANDAITDLCMILC
jgi:hypothetical protein